MTSRNPVRLVPALTLTGTMLAASLATGASTASADQPSEGKTSSYAEGTCTTTKLSGVKPVRTRSGNKLGTAQMFAATSGDDLGFCVRIKPAQSLRKTTTQALLPHTTYFPDGQRSSSGLVGGSGAWRNPFLVTGCDFGTGYSMKATAKIVVPGGPSGKAKIEGTLP